MEKSSRIYVAGHRGLVGSAILRLLMQQGYNNLILRTHAELDLTDRSAVRAFFDQERPEYVILAAAKVGGILANDTYPADFIRENLAIEISVIDASYRSGVKRLLFLGSSCIYPKMAPQPIKEEYLLTGPLEPTNRPYALAKIAGIEMCWSYNRQYGTGFPLTLLRIWRRGKAHIEDRWMDEHMYLTEGRAVTFHGGFSDYNLNDLTFFTAKHNYYAGREALDALNQRLHLFEPQLALTAEATATQAKIKRFFKESVYNRLPFEISATLYFLFRYVLQLGFLDGRAGLVYHVLQGFWYRFLVGAKLNELELAVKKATSEEEIRSEVARLTRQKLS